MSPLSLYNKMIKVGKYKKNLTQSNIIYKLNLIHKQFYQKFNICYSYRNLFHYLFIEFLNLIKNIKQKKQRIKSLYLWGDVGNGKTWMMDLFYESLQTKRKLKLNFNTFINILHKKISLIENSKNKLDLIASSIKKTVDIICCDEFFISDISNAMLFKSILEKLLYQDMLFVITSNISPDNLYINGLNRELFLPTIKKIKDNFNVIYVDINTDFRKNNISSFNAWFTPINNNTNKIMNNIFEKISNKKFFKYKNSNFLIKINNRLFKTLGYINNIISFDFKDLCDKNFSQNDYVYLSKKFNIILIYNVAQMNHLTDDIARRFLSLIDELYLRRVKLIASSLVALDSIYIGNLLKFEYKRCISRLYEMQKKEYLQDMYLCINRIIKNINL
ncbi:MAG: cell division protein ZapE [Enterobacterales bacterium]